MPLLSIKLDENTNKVFRAYLAKIRKTKSWTTASDVVREAIVEYIEKRGDK